MANIVSQKFLTIIEEGSDPIQKIIDLLSSVADSGLWVSKTISVGAKQSRVQGGRTVCDPFVPSSLSVNCNVVSTIALDKSSFEATHRCIDSLRVITVALPREGSLTDLFRTELLSRKASLVGMTSIDEKVIYGVLTVTTPENSRRRKSVAHRISSSCALFSRAL